MNPDIITYEMRLIETLQKEVSELKTEVQELRGMLNISRLYDELALEKHRVMQSNAKLDRPPITEPNLFKD